MARVELSAPAVAALDRLILTHSLPPDTRRRVREALRHLERFPRMGPALSGQWDGFRFLLGPWRWMVLVYVFDEQPELVTVVTVQDARSAQSVTAAR